MQGLHCKRPSHPCSHARAHAASQCSLHAYIAALQDGGTLTAGCVGPAHRGARTHHCANGATCMLFMMIGLCLLLVLIFR